MQFVSGVLITCIKMCLSRIAIMVYAIFSQAALFCFIFAYTSLFDFFLSVSLFLITLQNDVTDLLFLGIEAHSWLMKI